MVKGDVLTHSPHQSRREAWDILGAALGCLRKQRRYFKTGRKKSQTNKQLSVGHDRLETYYQAGQQDAWLY